MSSPEPVGGGHPVLLAALVLVIAAAAAGIALVPGLRIGLGIVACIATGLLGAFKLRDLARVRELRDLARAYAAGDFTRRADLSGADSIARLGRDLNALGDHLAAARGELEAQRGLLDGALGALAEGVACVDAMDRVVYANPAWRHLAGAVADPVGSPYYEHLPAAALAAAVAAVRAGSAAEGIAFEHRRRQLRTAVARASGVVVVVLHDLTELKRLESARRDFVAAVSHELKTPLTAIAGFAETLLDGGIADGEETVRDMVGRIARHAERLTVLVRDVLTLSRLEQGAWAVHPAPLDAAALLRQLVEEHHSVAAERGVRLIVEASGPLELVADPELLHQLIGNLVSNAIRYNRPDGAVWLRGAIDGGRLRVAVQDSGIGIPPEHRERIFERFFRVDAHRSRQSGGTGLGLAIVKQLVDTMQGSIAVESGGGGTTFTVELPLRDARARA